MQISLRDVSASPENKVCFDYTLDLKGEQVHFDYPFQEPVEIYGSVRDRQGILELTATIETNLHLHCSRCNHPFVRSKVVDVSFILAKSLQNEELDDIIVVEGDTVELNDILVPELILSMDMAVLCREDCRGVCIKCGKDLNEGDCGCKEPFDPRWDKLKSFLDQKK